MHKRFDTLEEAMEYAEDEKFELERREQPATIEQREVIPMKQMPRTSSVAPSWFDPMDAGESWDYDY